MAGKNRYFLAKELIKKLKKEYSRMGNLQLRAAIAMNLGSDEKRCVEPYLKLMEETGLITQDEGGWKFNTI